MSGENQSVDQFGEYLRRNADKETADKLIARFGPPAPPIGQPSLASGPPPGPLAPIGPPEAPSGPPTPEEMARYGAKPAEIAAASRYNAPGPRPPQAATNPTKADANWSPEAEALRTAAEREKSLPSDERPELGPEGMGRPSSPGHYVGPHWQPGTRSETIQHGIDESKLAPGQKERELAHGYGQWAAEDMRSAMQKEAAADVEYASARRDALQQDAARQQAIANEKRAYVAREHEKLDELAHAAQQQVDPEAAKGSAGAQLFAAIGVAMGQFGASLTGGPNTALQIVNANIDRRIKAQESNIANAHKSLENERSLYHENLDAFGDRERAVLATKVQYLDQAKALLDEQYANAKGNRNDAAYHTMAQGLADKRAEIVDQFGIRTADQIATSGNEHFVPGQVVGGGGGKPLANLVTLTDGTTVQMPNEKQQDKAIEKIQIVNQLQRWNNEALQVRKKMDDLDPIADRTAYNTAHKTLEDLEERKASALSTEAGQGVLRDSEYARAVSKQGFYTEGVGFFKGNPVAASARAAADANIRRQIKRGDEEQHAFVRAAGGHIVQRGYARGPDGQLAPVAKYTGQDVRPAEQLAPSGFKPMRKGADEPTADRPLKDTTDYADRLDGPPVGTPTGSAKGSTGNGPHVRPRK